MRKINAGGRGEVIITKKGNGRVEVEGNLCGSAAHIDQEGGGNKF